MNNADAPASAAAKKTTKDFLTVGIGASAGGIKALKEFFSAMPGDSGMAFVVILHLSQEHESHLSGILQNETAMTVTQVTETLTLEPNNVYVIPPSKHLKLVDGVVKLVEPERTRGRRVPIDLLFRTLGEAHGKNAVCIVLSGTGSDGTLGLKRVKESGGIAIVQDPSEAEYDGMPRSAIETNLADVILPIAEMPAKLLALKLSAAKLQVPDEDTDKPPRADLGADALREVLTLLRIRTGHDFSNYKRPTLLRRVARRLNVHELADIPAYLDFLRENPDEIQSLLRDLLISVTNFFRDHEAFAELEREIVPRLFHGKGANDQIRVWVAGCATGEEAYSIAILLCEYAEKLDEPPKIQIFASDIDEQSIGTARDCRYDEAIVADVSPARLKKFFVKEGTHYRVKKSLRETVLFAPHNILRDPPFSKLDLISCRNLLIYLNRETQKRVFEIFHFALRREGFLLLGSSESAEGASALFSTVDKKHRIYKSRVGVSAHRHAPVMPIIDKWRVKIPDAPTANHDGNFSFGELHHKLVEKYAPPSVLVNEDYDILHLSESVGRFLRFTGGEPSRNLLTAVHPNLRLDLRAALIEAKQEKRAAESRHVAVNLEGENVSVNLIVRPFETPETADGFLLVIFEEHDRAENAENAPALGLQSDGAAESIVRRLEDDLQQTKNRLRATTEQNETSVEELRASNEELQAINEELRSASEELETSKEELQSVNEELVTVNHELKDKIDEVSHANSDLQNLMSSTDIGTIFLDRELQIKRYTPPAQRLFNIIPSDIGRPLEHITHKLEYDDLVTDAAQVLRSLKPFEREICDTGGDCYLARFLPYRTLDDKIDGVVLTFIDINERKQAKEALHESEENFRHLANSISQFAWMTDADGWIFWYNERWFEYTGTTLEEMQGWGWQTVHHPNEIERVVERFKRHIASGEAWEDTFPLRSKTGEYRWFLSRALPIRDANGSVVRWFGTNTDIEDVRRAEEKLKDADKRKDEFLAMLAHELRNPLAPIRSGLEIIRRADCDEAMIEQTLETVERQTNQIVHLVDDLLDISRITQGKIKLKKERIELRTAVEMALETNREVIALNGHDLTVSLPDAPVFLDADLTRIAQIILNLLNNSAKYTEPDGKIWLTAETKAHEVEISIRDTGIGIPPEMLSDIFEMFKQIETTAEQARAGLGIGLSVVKSLVEMHDGTIEAFSAGKGKGSEFVVLLPLAAKQLAVAVSSKQSSAKEMTQTNENGADKKSAQHRILVVDDNADALEMMKVLLTLDNHIVRTALDGETAIKIAPEFQPQVCILDIGLPIMNGYELARRLREQMPQVFLIALSGWGQDEDRRRSSEAGFNHHLVKPIEIEELENLLVEIR